MKKIVLVLMTALALSCPVQAATFDCLQAETQVEKLICADNELSKFDEDLAAAYAKALKVDGGVVLIQHEQKQWVKLRDACADATCVKDVYLKRLTLLSTLPKYGHCADVRKVDLRQCGNANSGKGYTVCESYLKHLNTLVEKPYCQTPVPPGFKSPDWEELDVLQHLDWAYWMDIRFRAPGGYTPPDFESWRKAFVDKLKVGKIAPQMRKVRIKPLGEDEATILAFTRDRSACKIGFRNDFDDDRWGQVGYMHWELTGDPAQPLRALGENNSQAELLLFSGHPYFVQSGMDLYGPDSSQAVSQPTFTFYKFFARQKQDDGLHYKTMQLCYLEPDNPLGIASMKRAMKK